MQATEKLKAKIPTEHGFIEIEGDIDSIKQILSTYAKKESKPIDKKNTVKGLIAELIENGFFKDPKTLIEIREELSRRGFPYKTNTLFPILFRDFIRPRRLEREGTRRNYKYFAP